jgi:predicted P-loop ATPase
MSARCQAEGRVVRLVRVKHKNFFVRRTMAKIVSLPPPLNANAERTRRLFEWAAKLLGDLGLAKAVAQATSIEELRGITLNVGDPEVSLAIRDALHPATGDREDHFHGLREGALKQILKNRLADLKRDREKILRRRAGAERDWTDDLILNANGQIIANLANLILILRKAPKWEKALAYDEFNACVVIRRAPPWGKEEVDAQWTDHHESLARAWFQSQKINPSAGDVGRAVQAAARHNKFHPVREHFESLTWDGVPRLDTWLIDYFHAEDSAYVRAIGPRYLISAVARIFRPGEKVDTLIILEGPQGKQKSEALRTLAIREAWFTDRLSHVASKDAAIEVQGVLIIEIGEMLALVRASASAQKAFITRRYDRFRPPHAKYTISLPRQCVFAGTINPPPDGRYLKDETGARRFWPVKCHGMVDRDGLEEVRDQLWAEAVQRFKASEPWWLETPELEALAAAEQAARFVIDEWEQPMREWVDGRTDVSVTEVLEHALGFPRKDWTQSAQTRVAKILKKRLGFVYWRPRKNGRKPPYRRAPEPEKVTQNCPDQPDRR